MQNGNSRKNVKNGLTAGFKMNRNRLIGFPNLWGYVRDLYQLPGIGETTDFEAIKAEKHMEMQESWSDESRSRHQRNIG